MAGTKPYTLLGNYHILSHCGRIAPCALPTEWESGITQQMDVAREAGRKRQGDTYHWRLIGVLMYNCRAVARLPGVETGSSVCKFGLIGLALGFTETLSTVR